MQNDGLLRALKKQDTSWFYLLCNKIQGIQIGAFSVVEEEMAKVNDVKEAKCRSMSVFADETML